MSANINLNKANNLGLIAGSKLKSAALLFFIFLAVFFCSLDMSTSPGPAGHKPGIEFVDSTRAAGLVKYTSTFAVAVVDINNDGSDDLVIINHGQVPSLYLNKNGIFENHSHLLPEQIVADRHGITAADFDNDGDKDLIIAGGGSDGIGPGHINRLYQNLLCETGNLSFENISLDAGIAYQPWRARHFLPLPNKDGSLINLYLVCKLRPDHPNLFFVNNSSGSGIKFAVDESYGLNQCFNSRGKDIFFDYDRDGDQDLLIILKGKPAIYENVNNRYKLNDLIIKQTSQVYCAGVGDLNCDGYPDLYFGMDAKNTASDRISFNDEEIHFVVQKQEDDAEENICFNTKGKFIDINFAYRIPGKMVRDPANIFIGRNRQNPPGRQASIPAEIAEGEPVCDRPGIYIWKNPGSSRWHVEWFYGAEERQDKGKIIAESITNLQQQGFETQSANKTRDRLFINKKGKIFEELVGLDLSHNCATRSVVMCDLNNDGWLDIAGIRGSETGRCNGEPFALVNYGNLNFDISNIMQNEEDDIYQADQCVFGFFNDDGLPDLFFTNGYGLNPGYFGPYKLFLNKTRAPGNYVILELEGRTANRDAVGAVVELITQEGDFLGYRQLGAGFNRSQSSHKLHFGLGYINNKLLARIKWPGTRVWDERRVVINKINYIKQL